MRLSANDADQLQASRPAPFNRSLVGWLIVAVSLGVAAIVFTSRPGPAIGQTGPALTPPPPTPRPPPEEIEIFVSPYAHGAEAYDRSRSDVRVLDVSTRESTPSRRRLPLATPEVARQFIEATTGGHPIIGVEISVGATGRSTLPGSLTRTQLARLCFPSSMKPPGIDVESLVVSPGRLVAAHMDLRAVCVEFVFTEPGAFVVGTRPLSIVPEFAKFYASTGGADTWGPCLTNGFFVTVGPGETIIETDSSLGVYVQICVNGVLGYHPQLAGSGYEVQPVLATSWVRGENGQYVGPDPPARIAGAGQYFPQTGHNLNGALLNTFQALGGADVLGYPITEALAGPPGFTDQYFQHLKLRINDTTGEVTIRPIGREFIAMLAANHQAGSKSPLATDDRPL